MPKKAEKTGRSFEEDLKRLEEIVGKLESGSAIEESLVLYEEGIKLSNLLETKLNEIERRVYEVKNISKLISGEENDPDMGLFKS